MLLGIVVLSVGKFGQIHRVIARLGSLAGVAVDEHELQSIGERCGGQDQINAQALLLVEAAVAVVPVRVETIFRVALTHGVGQTPSLQLSKGVALCLNHFALVAISNDW